MTPLTSVLIVDDEPAVRDIMARWAGSLGLNARTAGDAEEALALLKAEPSDLAVIDIMMPGRDGLWLANELQRDHPQTAVVLATAYTSLLQGDRAPVADLLVKPFARGRFELAVDRGRRWRKDTLEDLAWHARLLRELRDCVEQICTDVARHAIGGATETDILLAMALMRTPETMAHSERVTRYAMSVARELGLAGDDLQRLEGAARLHDMGKLAIPESLLTKPSALSPGEQAIVRRHVDTGAEILASTRSLHDLASIVVASHEWFGGGGYPRQLAGDAIPLAARIIAVVDAYDAMTQTRQYRGRVDSADAVCELLRCSGNQFDPAVVNAFLAVLGTH
jgi:putative two-component system response regulator